MSKNTLLRRAIRLALANAAAASVALPMVAAADNQSVAAPAAAPTPAATQPALQEVVVTGSRIVQPGLKSISPVTALSAKDIASQGTTSVEDILNNLPQVTAEQGSMLSNGATGTATVNLRDLGPQRTLVLINGRRLMPGDATNNHLYANAADIDFIPVALIERVDVLTGGASAVYGADAVAGVVNFVMNDHFQGFEVDVNGSAYQHDQHSYFSKDVAASGYTLPSSSVMDGATKDVTFIMGSNFADGKGNATGYIEYRRQEPLLENARDFSACTLSTGGCAGSGTNATGTFLSAGFQAAPNQAVPNFFPQSLTVHGGQLVPETAADLFNFGAVNYYMRPDQRWNAGGFVHYNIDDNHQVYSEFMMMDDQTDAQIAPSGMFTGSGTGINPNTGDPFGGWTVNCNNPYLSAQEATTIGCASNSTSLANTQTVGIIMGRRNVEGGNRTDLLEHTSYRLVIGSQGQISDNLNYNVYAQEGYTLHSEEYLNDVSKNRLTQALLAVDDPATGQVVCEANANGANGAPGCVPYNIWGTGAVSPGAVSYFGVPGLIEGDTEERVFHADMTADLSDSVKLPTANQGLGLNYGLEYREEFMSIKPDLEFITNDLAGQGSATLPLNAGYGVKEGFLEARLPLVQDKPFAKEISLDAGYRYSKYDVGYTTNTYKLGLDWSPTSDVRFRGGYNRAVRAPSIAELFAEKQVALDGTSDPCAFTTSTPEAPATASECARSGMTPAAYGTHGTPGNPASQYNGLVGGNPQLKPEIADTYTFGIVVTPSMLPRFSATVDVYDIKIKDLISTYGANLIVDSCVNDDNPQFCSMVHRDAAGSLWFSQDGYVEDPLLNLGYEKEDGVDVSANYTMDIGWLGSLNFNLIGTYTASLDIEPYSGSGSYNCAGYFGGTCNTPLPKWKHTATVGWATPWHGLGLEARWRHIGNTEIDLANPSPLLHGSYPSQVQYAGSRDYLDLVGTDQIWSGVQLQVGINNVLDKDPPILAWDGLGAPYDNGNTYPEEYDTLGRFIFANLKIDF